MELTTYSYEHFDVIIKDFGYEKEKNVDLHNYFDWANIRHWSFVYEPYSELELSKLFSKTIVVRESMNFLIRLKYNMPLIQVNSSYLKDMLSNLCFETGMGWEAISVCGKYIIEFTDGYEYLAKSNFKIRPT
ncbi:MAG TPA: hypothetical protein VNS58_30595 [Puia sp.]|nr:hypothetical protein [Puia sp.]